MTEDRTNESSLMRAARAELGVSILYFSTFLGRLRSKGDDSADRIANYLERAFSGQRTCDKCGDELAIVVGGEGIIPLCATCTECPVRPE